MGNFIFVVMMQASTLVSACDETLIKPCHARQSTRGRCRGSFDASPVPSGALAPTEKLASRKAGLDSVFSVPMILLSWALTLGLMDSPGAPDLAVTDSRAHCLRRLWLYVLGWVMALGSVKILKGSRSGHLATSSWYRSITFSKGDLGCLNVHAS